MRTSASTQMTAACICLLVILSTACTTLRPVSVDSAGERIQAEIRVGDTVSVLMVDGSSHTLHITTVGASSLAGTAVNTWKSGPGAGAGSLVELPYADMRQVEVRRFSRSKTTGLAAAIAVAAVAIIVGVATGGGQHSPGFNR